MMDDNVKQLCNDHIYNLDEMISVSSRHLSYLLFIIIIFN